ncbi:DNA/RNA helicase domain-containing protein [Winogradskyella thalassocola]|uniref:Uncharacterized conserved protein n=1 Tax=Winogradskyella thalassocola TaxID=262004 RepID=A0A1G7ZNS5_9FLAO|nr:DNA/RNA helicase domain-containing protein [Winogradskyella thalassocola]SDH10363.1 Uncharacterized conserved protein [Winogradskyella thalassocola]
MLINKYDNTVYTIQSFLDVEVADWGNRLKDHHIACMNEKASYSQRKAWFDCYNILKREFTNLKLAQELANSVYCIFEYELPRERGRRPDVLLLSDKKLIVLEFKGYSEENQAQIDQAKHYARDLRNYHEQSHDLTVIPFLVLASAKNISRKTDGVQIVSGDKLHLILRNLITNSFEKISDWYYSNYAPLPSLIQSAQLLFKTKEFPQIKQALSAGIPITIKKLKEISIQATEENSHYLALITGVPGAGKTLVGLQLVHETDMLNKKQASVFLSGNGPLVQVLQYSLGNTHFIKGVHDFLRDYASSTMVPSEHIIIYDEAQRAWDSEKASLHRKNSNSEPTDFINVGNKRSSCLLIGLIGEGQEIHLGEESGMKLWADAVKQSYKTWKVFCPKKLNGYFEGSKVENIDSFDLTTSLRTHQAITLQKWVDNLLENKIEEAKKLMENLFDNDYPVYVTRDLNTAKNHVKNKYIDEPNKTYGLIASSKSIILPKYGVNNDYNSTKSLQVARYYADEKHSNYCRNLTNVVTEFACQGLELDMPILAWDKDWIYNNEWIDNKPNNKAKKSKTLRSNSYRVLLTRGRDGLIIYIPNDKSLDNTFIVLIESGSKKI